MRFWVLALAAVELLLQSTARSEPPGEVPFQYRDGLIWIKVELAGTSSPLNFLLDSGASVSAVDLRTAEIHGLRLGDQQPVEGVSGHSSGYRIMDLQASLGGNALPKQVLAIDLGAVSECCHQHIDGILGVDFFRGRVVRIDFSAGKVCLSKSCYTSVANCDVLPVKMCNGAFCVSMQIDRNPTQWMRLDTGCDSAVEWVVSTRERRQMSGASVGLTGASTDHINTWVQLGSHSFNDIRAGVHRKPIFPGEDGLVGNGLLSKFCLIIDEPRGRVLLKKAR